MSSVPAGIRPSRERYGTAHRPNHRIVERRADGMTIERDGARTKFLLDGKMMRWATSYRVSQEFLDACKQLRDQERRAPMGDKTGCWQKCAEVPAALLFDKIPPDAWADERAIAKFLNSSDFRAFRTDGNHRKL